MVKPSEAGAVIEFEQPQFGVAPGQAAVFYSGSQVLGGGWITAAERAAVVPLQGSGRYILEKLMQEILRRALQSPSLGYTVKFALGDLGTIRWDGTRAEPVDHPADGPAGTSIHISEDNLEKLISGALDPTLAYMTGKLKVEGSLGVAMKLTSLLGD